jgi:hypothetical protein
MNAKLLALLLGFAISAASLAAQDTGTAKTETPSKTVTVTGCLAQADSAAGEYVIKAGEGMSYGLESSGQNLKAHVGHKVTISGTSLKGKGPHDDDRIQVTKLVMVSTTCP